MAVIVKHERSGDQFILLGTGFGAFKATKLNWFFGNMMADESAGEHSVVAVCNAAGEIGWFGSDELTVVSIDGAPPNQIAGIN